VAPKTRHPAYGRATHLARAPASTMSSTPAARATRRSPRSTPKPSDRGHDRRLPLHDAGGSGLARCREKLRPGVSLLSCAALVLAGLVDDSTGRSCPCGTDSGTLRMVRATHLARDRQPPCRQLLAARATRRSPSPHRSRVDRGHDRRLPLHDAGGSVCECRAATRRSPRSTPKAELIAAMIGASPGSWRRGRPPVPYDRRGAAAGGGDRQHGDRHHVSPRSHHDVLGEGG